MLDTLNDEQRMLRDSLQRCMAEICTPDYLQRLDREARYPYEAYAAWVELGLLGRGIPEAYGGYEGTVLDLALIAEELAYWSYDVSTAYTVPLFTGMTVLHGGTHAQRMAHLPRLANGSLRLCVGISEPSAGSDVAAIRTRAERYGDGWRLNGQKLWTTAASARDTVILVYARSSDQADPRKGLSAFLVPSDAPGVEIRKLDTLGRRAVGTHEVFLRDVCVSDSDLLGEVNLGWKYLLAGLQTERALTAAGYAGSCRRVVDISVAYARERQQSGRSIGEFQAVAHMLADMQMQASAAALLAGQAANKIARGEDALREVAMAKLFGSEAYVQLSNMGMQIMGAYGYSMEYEMQRHLRDARSTTIGAGTSQIQRNVIAATLGFKLR